jgi:hypothetical protein
MKSQQDASNRALSVNPKIPSIVDFSTIDLYVGIDVHKERWQVAVYYGGAGEGFAGANIFVDCATLV